MHKDTSRSHILIAGLGRLGAPVASQLAASGYRVSGIRRSPVPLADVDVFPQNLVNDTLKLPTTPVDLLIIVLTPTARNEAAYRASFIQAPQRLLDALARQQPLPPTIFVSSTAVFGDREGTVDETTPPQPTGFNGRILLVAEQALQQRTTTTCVRFAGIYGGSHFWQQRAAAIARGEQPLPTAKWMNRIHQDDCIGLLCHLAKNQLNDNPVPQLVIGCDNNPLCNHQLLQQLAKQQGLTLALPTHTAVSGKRIESQYIKAGHYTLMHRVPQ